MLKKLLITPWLGQYPNWFGEYLVQINRLEKQGYQWLFFSNPEELSQLVSEKLGISVALEKGTSQTHNLRPAFGILFEDYFKGFDYWGITDLDCVYGDIKKFLNDKELGTLDIWSNHHSYICGPWTLFKNTEKVNNLFRQVPNWESFMTDKNSHPGRWTEEQFSRVVEASGLKYKYTFFQSHNPNDLTKLTFKNNRLYDDGEEIMMAHFNRKKEWPL